MEEFLSPVVYNYLLDEKVKYEDYSIKLRKQTLINNFLITTLRLNNYNYDLTMFFNNKELREEISLYDLLLFCHFLNINLSHIENLEDKDELYDILFMVIIIYHKFKNITLKNITDNSYLQKLIYLSLDVKYWIKKSIEKLYQEILNESLSIQKDSSYDKTYQLVKKNYNEFRCSNHKFIVKREIYMMLDKNLSINILEDELKTNPTQDMFNKCFIEGSDDIKYLPLSSLKNSNLFTSKIDYIRNINNNYFYYIGDILYYGNNKVEDESMYIKYRKQMYLLSSNKDIIKLFNTLISKEFNDRYEKLMGVRKSELKEYLNRKDIYDLIFNYKYLNKTVKDILSYMLVDNYMFLDDYILSGHKNILVYIKEWLKRL